MSETSVELGGEEKMREFGGFLQPIKVIIVICVEKTNKSGPFLQFTTAAKSLGKISTLDNHFYSAITGFDRDLNSP